ncbi:MAG: glycine cleavage system protein GcvH [Rhodospirillaceae bacterium]
MNNIRYTKEHEWISYDGESATVGITDYAQSQLGDIVFVELPQSGSSVTKGGEAAVVESVKAASEVYAPASGTVTESNDALIESPDFVNTDPGGGGWFFKMTISDATQIDGLMDQVAYDAYLKNLDE